MEQFYKTHMGKKFYQADMPKIVKSLDSIAKSLDTICKIIELESEQD